MRQKKRNVHVHLDWGRNPITWSRKYQLGQVWDEDPYGYRHMEKYYALTYSVDKPGRAATLLARRVIRKLLGFDVSHAWHNRENLLEADIVVTHTELEYLAALLVLRLRRDRRKKVVCQAVWLWDSWAHLSRVRRSIYRNLMSNALACTTLSTQNHTVAACEVSPVPCSWVPFGIKAIEPALKRPASLTRGLRVLSAGNDKHRDWKTLASALRGIEGAVVRVRSGRALAAKAFTGQEADVRSSVDVAEFHTELAWADVVVVPLHENLHASGITVALEAVSAGRPLVVADTGGLRDYLGASALYYKPGDSRSLAEAIEEARERGVFEPVGSGTKFLRTRGLRSIDYAERHVALIEGLLESGSIPGVVSTLRKVEVEFDHLPECHLLEGET